MRVPLFLLTSEHLFANINDNIVYNKSESGLKPIEDKISDKKLIRRRNYKAFDFAAFELYEGIAYDHSPEKGIFWAIHQDTTIFLKSATSLK